MLLKFSSQNFVNYINVILIYRNLLFGFLTMSNYQITESFVIKVQIDLSVDKQTRLCFNMFL